MALDLNKVRQEVGQTGKDLTKPTQGGDFEDRLPAEGPTRLRLVSLVEYGIHTTKFQGAPKRKPRAELGFELSGPKHEPRKLDDGTLIPYRLTTKEVVGTHQKNGYIKLFNLMNVDGDAKNFVDMLMEKAWLGTVNHSKFTGRDGQERTKAYLKPKGGEYQIRPTVFPDPETGEPRQVSVAPAISTPRLFLWDYADLDMWDSLLDYQKDMIREAENFVGSPIYVALAEAGRADEYALSEEGQKRRGEGPEEEEEGETPAPAPAPAPAAKPVKAPASPAKAPKAAPKAKPAAETSDPLQGL